MKKNKRTKKYYFKLKEVIILILTTAVVVCLATSLIITNKYNSSIEEEYISDKNISNFLEAYKVLTENYYKDIDKTSFMNSVITYMSSYFEDPYTSFLDKNQTTTLMDSLTSEYEGIGIKIIKSEEGIVILEVFEDAPAYQSGLKVGDVIIKVDGEDITYKPASRLATLIQSKKKLTIGVLRDGKELSFETRTEKVFVPSVYSDIHEEDNKKIGYLNISSFSTATAKQFANKLTELENQGIESLIIDVRNNSGGYLTVAEDIAELFIEKGKILYSLEDKSGKKTILDKTDTQKKYPVVVITNNHSASASEVLAGALKDSYNATIVGQTSYGKGKVQQTEKLTDGAMLKYTSASWDRPNGENIDGIGIIPDYEVPVNEKNDELIKAIEVLTK